MSEETLKLKSFVKLRMYLVDFLSQPNYVRCHEADIFNDFIKSYFESNTYNRIVNQIPYTDFEKEIFIRDILIDLKNLLNNWDSEKLQKFYNSLP